MQELLTANERHHALLMQSRGQDDRLHEALAEVERLKEELTGAEQEAQRRRNESTRDREALLALREAYELQAAQLEAAEAEVGWLQAALASAERRGEAQVEEVSQLQQGLSLASFNELLCITKCE